VKKLKAKNLVPISDSIIYIMSDGVNSKIGITTNLQNRVSTYKTHNPTATLFSHYICSKAKDIELAIKTLFKDKTITSSKEWFNLNPNYLDRIVSLLVHGENNTHLDIIPAMNHVPLHDDFIDLIDDEDGKVYRDKYLKASEIFAREFNLGIPRHLLPDSVIRIEGMPIDIYECRITDFSTHSYQTSEILYQDHSYYFYHLVNLTSGKQIALCTSFISMPYHYDSSGTGKEEKRNKFENTRYPEILEDAKDRGYYVFRHDNWSWHNRGETALFLVMQKTPVSKRLELWKNSFRKWILERKKAIEQESFKDSKDLIYAIEDVCGNAFFPLHIQGSDDFAEYLFQYHIDYYDKASFPLRDAFDFLFAKWKGVDWIPRIDPVVDGASVNLGDSDAENNQPTHANFTINGIKLKKWNVD
jgi:hypothetical protein